MGTRPAGVRAGDREIVGDMNDTAGEGDVLLAKVCLKFGDLFTNICEGNGVVERLAWLREAVHRCWLRRWRGRRSRSNLGDDDETANKVGGARKSWKGSGGRGGEKEMEQEEREMGDT